MKKFKITTGQKLLMEMLRQFPQKPDFRRDFGGNVQSIREEAARLLNMMIRGIPPGQLVIHTTYAGKHGVVRGQKLLGTIGYAMNTVGVFFCSMVEEVYPYRVAFGIPLSDFADKEKLIETIRNQGITDGDPRLTNIINFFDLLQEIEIPVLGMETDETEEGLEALNDFLAVL